jgi:hypothetical protein
LKIKKVVLFLIINCIVTHAICESVSYRKRSPVMKAATNISPYLPKSALNNKISDFLKSLPEKCQK